MKIKKIDDQPKWEEMLDQFQAVSFLQSWNWGQFEQELGSKVTRLLIEDGKRSLFAQYYLKKSRLFNFVYCPRGPVTNSPVLLSIFIDEFIRDAKEYQADFLLIEPDTGIDLETLNKKFRRQTSIQPDYSLIVSLQDDLETVFYKVRKTTRQMIRKALENKIVIESYPYLTRWDEFAELFKETIKRQKFNPHSTGYMKKQFQILAGNHQAKLYLADLNGKAVAGAVIVSYRKTSFYLHAASTFDGRKLGAAHLLVWTAIKDAKAEGNHFFDLWGIAPDDQPNHKLVKITTFKLGFGGEKISYPGGFIIPVRLLRYQLYRLAILLRKLTVFKTIQRVLLSRVTRG